MKFKVGVEYRVWGTVTVEADSKEDLMKKLNDRDFVRDMELPDTPEYVEDSYEVDLESVDSLN